MKKVSVGFLFLFLSLWCYSQEDTLQARIILIGDAGDFKDGRHPVIDAVKKTTKLNKKTTVVFMGDNLYTTGLPDEQNIEYDIRRSVLDTQIAIANGTDAKVYFLPGNHDWDKGGKGGWNAILRQQQYIDAKGDKNVKFYPEGGCGGPVEVNVSEDVTMIIFDSQWWIHPYDKPGIESDCPYKTKLEVLSEIEDIISKNEKKLVILTSHHPLKSFGIHGGYFTLKQHIFPLTDLKPNLYVPMPVIGSIYPIARGVFGVPEDLSHPAYANMIKDIEKVTKDRRNVIFVAGHEHNLQYIKDTVHHYIVSGSGTKHTRVSPNKNAPFVSNLNGYAVLNISKNKNVDLSFYTVADSISKAYSTHLLNISKLPVAKAEDIPVVHVPYSADSITVVANEKYKLASKTHRFFSGDNYRDVWGEPVRLKVFRVNEEMGGFKVGDMGGGHQTRSLRLTDKNGKEWTLRTINKDIRPILPDAIQGTAAEAFLQDFISSSHPYAALIVPGLAKATGTVVASPKIFFIPNDPALGQFRSFFANSICLLEERQPTPNGEESKSEQKVVNKLIEDNDNHVNQQAFLKARLLDFLIGDWDRHFDQWRFAEQDTGKGKYYLPIPRDRDQAFAYSDGILAKVGSVNLFPFLQGFRKKIPDINWLAYWARDLDRTFLNGVDSAIWRKTVNEFVAALPDDLIDNEVKKMPREIYAVSGATISEKLKNRRNLLASKEAMEYYKFLSKKVNVVGSNKNEYFKIESVGKDLQVKVYKKTKETDSASLVFSRIFQPATTKEINMYGLNGEDFFEIDQSAKSPIKLRIIGGRGEDTFNMQGTVKNYLYDLNTEKNFIVKENRSNNRFSDNPDVNSYSSTGFNYNRYSFPNLNIGYNAEDGLMAGIGFSRKTFGFRKDPYSTFQRLNTLYAFSSGSYKVRYNGEFNHVLGNNDLLINGELANPTLNNFFGIGNSTSIGQDKQYYRVRYNYIIGDLLIRKRITDVLHISAGPTFYNYWNHLEDNQDKILSKPSLVGLDSVNVYQTKTYAGGKMNILINNVNSNFMPTRGILWNTEFSALRGINKNSRNLTTLTSDMTLYSSLSDPARVVSILRLGGGHIFSKNYEYFQALNIGQNNFLRGFRKNRFSGNSLAYGSLTMLVKLFDSKSYILPGSVGVIAFDDVGRVWSDNQGNGKWHNAYGGGLYYSPFNMVLISAALGFSEEETLFNLSIGTKFNLTF